jgi:hypothetical protein
VSFLQAQQDFLSLAVLQLKMISSTETSAGMQFASLETGIEMYVSWRKTQIRNIFKELLLLSPIASQPSFLNGVTII